MIVRPRSSLRRAALLCLVLCAFVCAFVSIRSGVTATRRRGRPADRPRMPAAPRRSAAVVERPDGVASSGVTDGSDDVLRETDGETVVATQVDEPAPAEPALDLTRIEHDLAGVEAALRRLDDGTYWIDEVTGDPLDEALLVADPVARRNR